MKKTIWQKVDQKIARLKIFRNSALLVIHRVLTDTVRGVTTTDTETFTVACAEPSRVSADVNTPLVQHGDLTLTLDYLAMRKIWEQQNVGLEWNENSGILRPGLDEIEFAGVTYAIRSITPQDWQNDRPGQYVVVLKGATEATGLA